MLEKEKYFISFSGGRTSGYMTKLLLDNLSWMYDFIVTFTNTRLEHPKTLDFVNNCDKHFGFNTVWIEAVVHHGIRKSPTHRIVTYETASRHGEPFEQTISKYGIPNKAFPQCTRDLKVRPMESYLKTLGVNLKTVPTAIGIREDEKRRVSKDVNRNIQYPLIDIWPTDKREVLDWWKDQPFDLGIDEFEGNCQGCFKKSLRKHFMQIERDPSVYDFHRRMEAIHRFTGPQTGERVFFRENMSTEMLFHAYEELKGTPLPPSRPDEDGGCSESCEIYETLVGENDA